MRPDFKYDRFSGAGYNRIYIGSYYCDHYFLQAGWEPYRQILSFAAEKGLSVTLVVPPLFQSNLARGLELVRKIIDDGAGVVDEVTINDWGLADSLAGADSIRLNAGRLMQKDNRDPRYEDYFSSTYVSRAFSDFYKNFYPERGISGIELDCTHREIIIPQSVGHLQVSVHGPFCYISMGSICEFASMYKEAADKFRFADVCGCDCNHASILCSTQGGVTLLRLGRSIQFENPDCHILSEIPFRYIYSPYRELGVYTT